MSKLSLMLFGSAIFLLGSASSWVIASKRQRTKDVAHFSLLLTIGEAKRQKSAPDYMYYHAYLQDLLLNEIDKTNPFIRKITPKIDLREKLVSDFSEINKNSLNDLSKTQPVITSPAQADRILNYIYKK